MSEDKPLLVSQPLVSVNQGDDDELARHMQRSQPKTPVQVLSEHLSSLGDPLAKAGSVGTFFSALKIIIGVGSFVMPYQAGEIGMGGFILAISFLSALCFYTSTIMMSIKQEFTPLQAFTMPEFARAALPGKKDGRFAWNTLLGGVAEVCCLGVSIGGCSVYLSFTGSILSSIYCPIPAYLYAVLTAALVWLFILFQAILLVFKSWDPLLFISRISSVGVLLAVMTAVATLVYPATLPGAFPGDFVWFRPENLPGSFSNIAFLFAVALYLFPMHSSVQRPAQFQRPLLGAVRKFIVY